ncbi:hypothetical protein QMK33_19715 [Hymenobacter sp. H14-R3]|uniref:hypothetical protein n=1 Tax=Hymenobacter sp. H14-R3 TaxID=3046308 RepID=UPI0024B8E6EC|nr:hypothetical protein [Hymenobacter sp. H14-R3]MDJ0367382.1 hypothetical protein [Hymenobacter sp. H14-R3]
MALDCGKLKRGIAAGCEPATGGLQTTLVQLRKADIASYVRNALNPKLVTITMKQGTKGYVFEGLGESNVARAKMTPSKYGSPTYAHEVDMVAFTAAPADYATAEDLAKDKTVSVVRDNNGNILVYGLNAGLTATKNDTDSANADTGGAPEITLASTKEKGLADFFAVMTPDGLVDPVATLAAFEALYAA